ncbi:MAG: hypothetical protein CMJ89_13295 [Planctomycetes bacterium]|jgi:putative salt-induced outer membrane protein YdiY|nr:hypothetical protein [Planctomycetota bacterium]
MIAIGLLTLQLSDRPTSAPIEQEKPTWSAPEEGVTVWSGAFTVGTFFTEGNSDTRETHVLLDAERRSKKSRLILNSYADFAETDTETGSQRTVDNVGAGGKYDYFLSEDIYALGNGSWQSDKVAELDSRFILGAGAGWQVREDDGFKWSVEGGLSHVDQNFSDGSSDDYFALRLGSNITYQVSKATTFEQVAEFLPSLNGETYYTKWDNRLKMEVLNNWIAQLQYVLEYNDQPSIGAVRADYKFVFTLGWSFGK